MKKIVALLLCLCMLPVYALAADDGSWVIGVWTASALRMDGAEISIDEALGAGAFPIMVFHEDGRVLSVSLFDDGDVESTEAVWESVNGQVVIDAVMPVQQEENGTIRLAVESREVILRRATEEEIDPLRGRVELPRAAGPAATPTPVPAAESQGVHPGASEYSSLYTGAWVMESFQEDDGEKLDAAEYLDEGQTLLLMFEADGRLTAVLREMNGVFVEEFIDWVMDGKKAMAGDISFMTTSATELVGRVEENGEPCFLNFRRAEETEQFWLENRHGPAAETMWFLGTWNYIYSVLEGETEKSTMLQQEGDYVRVTFMENNVYLSEYRMDGKEEQEELPWEIRDSKLYANDCLVRQMPDGIMQVDESGDMLYFTRMAAPSTRREMEPDVSNQTPLSGGAGASLVEPRLTCITIPEISIVYGVSPSTRYAFGTRGLKELKLLDRETGRETPITFSAGRSAPGAALTQEGLEDGFFRKLKKVSWSADERYAALVYSGTTKDSTLCDLYILDAATGEIFVPAAWSKVMEDEGYGVVQDAAFAPDGTLYFLLETSHQGKTRFLSGPTLLYTCSPDTCATALVREMPGDRSPYPSLTCTASGDVLNIIHLEDDSYALLVGAQLENPRQIAIPPVSNIVTGKGDLLALQVLENNVGAGSTVSFLDLSQPAPTSFTGLVVKASGTVSQLPLLNKPYREVLGGEMIFDRWRDIRMAMKEGQYVTPLAADFSPDGTKLLLACSDYSFFLLDLATMQTKAVAPGENSPKSIASINWSDNGLIAIHSGSNTQLYRLEGVE